MRARGHQIEVDRHTTNVVVFGEKINIRLQEKLHFEESPNKYGWNTRTYNPSDILTFRMWTTFLWKQKVYSDGKQLLEKQLSRVMAGLELMAKKEIYERNEREKRWAVEREKERIIKGKKERIENEARAFKALFEQAIRLHQANIIIDYIQTVEANAITNDNISEELESWIKWAKDKVEWYNPLINKADPLLNDNYKTNIFKELLKEWQ